MASSTGFEAWDDILAGLVDRGQDVRPVAKALHREMLRQMNAADIPSRSGRLARSLQTDNIDHIFEADEAGISFGTRDPAATYNQKAVPALDGKPLAEIVAAWVHRGDRG